MLASKEHEGEKETTAVLNRINMKLDNILRGNRKAEEIGSSVEKLNIHAFEPPKVNRSGMSSSQILQQEKSNQHSKPPMPPRELVKPVWVSFASRSKSKVSNGSDGSKEVDEKKEAEKNLNDSSMSLSKKSDYRIRYLPIKPPLDRSALAEVSIGRTGNQH